jgi:thioesterase domain-containing protein
VLCYSQLVRCLGADQPVYAFQQSCTIRHSNHASLEAMAASYLEELLAVQSEGPFLLAGHSFGGVVALEMAQQLTAKGHRVSLLGLFDTFNPYPPDKAPGRARRIWDILQDIPPWLRYELLPRTPSQHHARFLRLVRRIKRKTAKLLGRSRVKSREEEIRQVFEVYTLPADVRVFCQANFRILWDYRPQIYPGTITLLRARSRPLFSPCQADRGWSRIAAGGLTTRVIPGTHDTILREPHVKVLAQELKDALSRI